MKKQQTAMCFLGANQPLVETKLPIPIPKEDEVLLKILSCGVCRTDLHIFDGELNKPTLPLIPGHQIVGEVIQIGKKAAHYTQGQRLGVPWLGETCGHCWYCQHQKENLCDTPLFTGYQLNGGYAEYCVAKADYCIPLTDKIDPNHQAPLLCAGLIGYRAFQICGNIASLAIYGFGTAAHILTQLATQQGVAVTAVSKTNDIKTQAFATALGAQKTAASDKPLTEPVDAAIIFAPSGALIPIALQSVRKGGIVVCGGIHMSAIPSFDYQLLWHERRLCSVANLTRQDGSHFFKALESVKITTHTTPYPLTQANQAVLALRQGKHQGAIVLSPLS